MKLRHHMPKNSALVGGLILVMTCLAPCEVKQTNAEKQTFARIEKRIEEAYDLHCSRPGETREAYFMVVRKILESLSEDEIRLVAQHVGFESEKEAYRMWARFDPAGALKAVRAFEDANADEIKLAGTGLEGGPGQAMQEYVFEMYLGALDGWAEVAPKAAWDAFRERNGPLSKSLVIQDFDCSFYRVLCEHLAKADPDRAFNDLISYRAKDFEEMNVASMLGGYLRGAPRGRDWSKEADRLLERRWSDDRLYAEMQTALMGRWLQDDAKAAEKWFHKTDVEGPSWLNRNDTKEVARRNDLASAAGYWAARDFPAAWAWMKSYNGLDKETCWGRVLHGADVFLSKSDAYFVGGSGARAFLLEQAAKLPDVQDREACLAMIEGAVVNTKEISGEPLEAKNSEQAGAGQPATPPESKSDGGNKPQPEADGRSR